MSDTDTTASAGSNMKLVKEFFEDGARPVTTRELIDLKKAHPGAVAEFADAIRAL